MTMTESQIVHPEPRISDQEYEAAIDEGTTEWYGVDATCILSTLTECVIRGLSDLHDEPYYPQPIVEDVPFDLEGERAVVALIRAGFLRREDFAYDDDNNVVRV